MADILVVPLKKPSDVDVITPLKNLIASTYSTADKPQDYSLAIAEFSKLRNTAIWKAFEKYESSLEIIYSYYDQICAMEAKIPSHEVQIPFKWKDAFDKGSLFIGRMSLTVSSLAYEKICVLFNIAALQSCVAASQSTETDEGRKTAAKLLQQAAGIFNHLRGIVMTAIQQDPTPDLNPETLSALSALMLAQAQECFVQKAIQDRMKDAVVAKLAAQCEELYAEALKQLQKETLRPLWDKEWIPIVAGKQAAYHGLSQFYQSLVCNANKAIGEEIARLEHALELFKAAQQRSNKPMFQDFVGRAQRALTDCKKDNDFIYHERVPDVKSLTPISKASLAKQLPIPERMSQDHKDLFEALVPVAVHQAMAAYSVRKSELVNTEIARLRESTQLLNSILASLNLPAALEDTSGSELPQSVRDKAGAVKANGGLSSLQNMVHELPELLQRNKDILDECDRMIQEEASSDSQLREQFKEKWTRIPSEKLTETFRANISKYQTIISNAVEADAKVRAKFETHREGITLLSGSPDQLNASVPSCAANAVTQSSAAQQLRALMEQVETIKAERDVVESELNSATTDIQAMFLQALSRENSISEQNLSVETLGRVYGPLQKQVQDSLMKQEALVGQIQRTNSEFCREKSGVGSAAHQREEMLKKLASAHDVYMELLGNLKEGSKFYNDLTQLLVTFQNKVSDYCFARKTEKEELMKDLTQEASRQASIPTPKASPHFETPPVSVPGSAPAPSTNTLPYPVQYTGMPVPYAAPGAAPYPTYAAMPSGYNPYSLPQAPYPQQPQAYAFPYGPPPGNYPPASFPGYPGGFPPQNQQQQQPPQQQQQQQQPRPW